MTVLIGFENGTTSDSVASSYFIKHRVSFQRKNLVRELRQARHGFGLSQRQLGGQLGTHWQFVGAWERGETVPDLATFIQWSMTLDRRVILEMA